MTQTRPRTRTAAVLGTMSLSALLMAGCSDATTTETDESSPSSSASSSPSSPAPGEGVVITRAEDREESAGAPENFTGEVTVLPQFEFEGNSAADIRFEAGARTAWHTHPVAQGLVITEGTAWVQERGQERITVEEGDIVWFGPGVEHWHGATADAPMTHTAINYEQDGSNVEWLELVTDEDYLDEG